MNLSMHDYLEKSIKSRLEDVGGELDFFFDAALNFVVNGSTPRLPSVSLSEKRDLVHVLKTLDGDILGLGMVVDWDEENYSGGIIYHKMSPEERASRGKKAFAFVSNMSEGYLEKLFYFYCLVVMFYGGIIRTDPGVVIGETFPFEIFDSLKPYVVSKKLEKEFTSSDKDLALKSISSSKASPVSGLPPYADENSYITTESGTYLVYDILKGANNG